MAGEGALGFILLFSTSNSMTNVNIVVTKIMILTYSSAFVKNSKNDCNVLPSFSIFNAGIWTLQDSNLRPFGYEPNALTN